MERGGSLCVVIPSERSEPRDLHFVPTAQPVAYFCSMTRARANLLYRGNIVLSHIGGLPLIARV
jgi:hypothetical protein